MTSEEQYANRVHEPEKDRHSLELCLHHQDVRIRVERISQELGAPLARYKYAMEQYRPGLRTFHQAPSTVGFSVLPEQEKLDT